MTERTVTHRLNLDTSAGRQRRMRFIAVAWGINVLAYSIVYPFLPIYLHTIRDIPMSTVGLIFPVMGLATIIGSPVSGWLSDRIGRRGLMVIGPLGRCGSFFLLAWMAAVDGPFWGFVLGLFLATFLGKFFQCASNAYITDLLPEEERLSAFNMVHVGSNIGWMIGPALGAFLARTPYSLMFSITALLCLATAAIAMFYCPKIPFGDNDCPVSCTNAGTLISVLRRDTMMLMLSLLTLCLFFSISQFATTLSVYATEIVGIAKTSLGFLYTINGAMIILFLMPVNSALKKYNLYIRISAGALLYTMAFMGFGVSTTWIHLALAMIVMTFGEILSLTAILSAVSRLAPSNMVGRYMGTHSLVEGLGWAIGPFIGSLLFEQFRSQGFLLWVLLSGFALIAGAGFFSMAGRRFSG
ncbi:MAG: MFS transporter [Desulfobacteraceae bacterium]|nr:MFS transporter [Desulfobacteraceae bacterium]